MACMTCFCGFHSISSGHAALEFELSFPAKTLFQCVCGFLWMKVHKLIHCAALSSFLDQPKDQERSAFFFFFLVSAPASSVLIKDRAKNGSHA